MEGKKANFPGQNRYLFFLAVATVGLLFVLFLIKEVTHVLEWGPIDFVFVGVLVFGIGTVYVPISRKHNNRIYRIALALALGTVFIMIWANLAVGLIGSEDESVNWIYIGLLAMGLIGAIIARFSARGMAITMGVMAFGQLLIIIIALMAGWQHLPHSSVADIFQVNGFFFVLWVLAAWLFWQARLYSQDKN